MMKNKYLYNIVLSAVIAALYAALTYAFAPISYGPVQFRVSEVLTILPCFTPVSIIGLTVGCLLANILSFNAIDMVIGTSATLIAAVFTYLLRKMKFLKIPFFSLLSPVIFNGLIVGLEIAVFFVKSIDSFPINAAWVALGELVVCFGLGIPFYLLLDKNRKIFGNKQF
ncbi:MAG: QueT transporter family protein [Clostridia bacterium]|nr:QueT transporter family protein [Clostridia bacterium]